MANKWRYECDCNNCEKVKRIVDPAKHMNGDYCTATVAGLKTIHADDDYVIRCDQYEPKMEHEKVEKLYDRWLLAVEATQKF